MVHSTSLRDIADAHGYAADSLASLDFADILDEQDELGSLREQFHYPRNSTIPTADPSLVDGEECIYLCGNSLGLCPKSADTQLEEEMRRWRHTGVLGWFRGSPRPWVGVVEEAIPKVAQLVGAKESEVMIMNSLTVNLHLMMTSFYQPSGRRNKILVEEGLFPSDLLAIRSQIGLHDLDPAECLLSVQPRDGDFTLRTEDIIQMIQDRGDEIALVMFSGVQFYTGQLFDMARITATGHEHGCIVGFDLAHAVGNVELRLHDWGVDWAAWCSYKYLCGGPGCVGGIFVHEKHDTSSSPRRRLSGWQGVDLTRRMEMDNQDLPLMAGARGYAVSCEPIMTIMPLAAALDIIHGVGMDKLVSKQRLLTGYLEELILATFDTTEVTILTPRDPRERGCQLSISFTADLSGVFDEISRRGVVCDMRRSHVLRVAPVPLYNSFRDVCRFVIVLRHVLKRE